MLFSIIIPFKESDPKFLQYCIDSLEEQILTDFEVIFVHDHSQQLEEALTKSSLNYQLIESTDETTTNFKNLALKQANGKFVLFMDGDDFLHPNALIYAKQMVQEDAQANVFKLAIKKTDLDKYTTLAEEEAPFYQVDTVTKLESFLAKKDLFVSLGQPEQLIQSLFQETVIPHDYEDVPVADYFTKINYHLQTAGLIVRRSFLEKEDLHLTSQNDLYADILFVTQLYSRTPSIKQTVEKLYFKMVHNDPITYPSHSQLERVDRQLLRVRAFTEAVIDCRNLVLAKQLKDAAVNYYIYDVVTDPLFADSYKGNVPIYQTLKELLKEPPADVKVSKLHSFEIKAIAAGKFKKAYFLSRGRSIAYNTVRFIYPKNKRYRQKTFQKYIFSKLPVKKQAILYESFLGRNYSDSPKAIFNYLLQNEADKWQHVWILDDKDLIKNEKEFENSNVKVIERFSWKYFYYVSVAKYFVLNMRQPKYLVKQAEQIILATWHGTPLKRLVFDMDNVTSANKSYKRDVYQQTRNWDYLLADNPYSEKIFESCFKFPKEKILTYGYPRNDVLINHTEEDAIKIKQRLGIPTDKKVILYAPTWRDDEFHSAGNYKFTLRLDLKRLRAELGEDYVIVLRMHYFISDVLDISEYEGFAFDFSKHNDINDLYIISDLLITDYSSVFFDFANLRRPILFYTYDLHKYKDELRGFYIDMEKDLPGPLLYTSDEVIESIKNIKTVMYEYEEKYKIFYEEFCALDDGQASQRVVNKVITK